MVLIWGLNKMIKYTRVDNSVFAYFDDGNYNQYAYDYWIGNLSSYFIKHSPGIESWKVTDIVHDVINECAESGMKFYGMAKCHPDDEYSQALGQHIAKHRLLDKYLSVRARIARRLSKDVSKTYYKLGKIAKTDRKKGW